jgi:transcriptional adapter 2-alpha
MEFRCVFLSWSFFVLALCLLFKPLLSFFSYSPEDHPSERALKIEVIQIYNKKLDERNRRKRFAIDRGLVDFRKQQQAERKRNKEERDLVARLRVFSRFQTPEEHEALVDGLIKARKLRNQIALYQHYRRMGVRTLEQGRQYDADRKKREIEFRAQKQRQQTPYLFQTGQVPSDNANRRRGQDDGLDGSDAKGLTGTNATGSGASSGAGTVVGRGTKRSVEDSAAILAKAPGVDLLSTKEVELCAASGMLPLHFLAIKEALVREAYRNGSLTLDGMQRLVRIEQPKAAEVFDFFVREAGVLVGEGIGAGTSKRAREE